MSTDRRYPTRNTTRIDQTTGELSTQLPSTRRIASSNIEHPLTDTQESQHLDNRDTANLESHSTVTILKTSDESIFPSFHQPQQPTMTSPSAQTYSLQTEIDYLRKELELLKLQQSQQHMNAAHSYSSNTRSFDRNPLSTIPPLSSCTSIATTPMHFIINTDPLQQMKDFVKPFYGKSDDDVDKWIESIIHYFDVARLPGDKEQLYFQYAPAFLKEYAYKWWTEEKPCIWNWLTFKQLLMEKFGKKNEYFIEQQLDQRKQQFNEPVIKYYYDIIDLCKRYDPNMSDKQKIRKLTNGLRFSLYQDAIKETYATPSEFLTKVQHLENIQKLIELRQSQIEGSTIWKDADSTSSLQQIQLHSSSKSQVSSNDPSSNRSTQRTRNSSPMHDEYSYQTHRPYYSSPNSYPFYQQYSSDLNDQHISPQSSITQHMYGRQPTTDYNRTYSSSHKPTHPSNGSSFQCYNCGQSGHIARHCSKKNHASSDSRQHARSKNQ
ncbi:unnamed protein product [Didymodactylos carnosus]|uniref:CCHC-type domain-containing protein n=2 Tax=Didymodactylos carnosus TaxID=1234261 RepID=A0A816B9E3_9BILA|nr:unnamed protein product [Didymodactylos carnosus]CAF4484977.1 unnamed protein product [Didymodactylos carnosus]